MSESCDHLSAEERSAHMRKIRKVDTKPELVVRRIAHKLGYRFRLHRRDLPGTPDMVFPRLRKIILIHGCFWHQHPGCKLARTPKSRLGYWLPKLRRNYARDISTTETLGQLGWDVLVIWECETRMAKAMASRISRFLDS